VHKYLSENTTIYLKIVNDNFAKSLPMSLNTKQFSTLKQHGQTAWILKGLSFL